MTVLDAKPKECNNDEEEDNDQCNDQRKGKEPKGSSSFAITVMTLQQRRIIPVAFNVQRVKDIPP